MSEQKVLNFNAGPAALPETVKQELAAAVVEYDRTGLSILEINHRGKQVEAIIEEANALVKKLCRLNEDYEVVWLQGGGRLQFAMVPMNFLASDETAGYIESGHWAADAMETAKYYGNVSVIASSKDKNFTALPTLPSTISSSLKYVHITTNNTIYGTQTKELPQRTVPLVADMSSDILSRDRDYANCAMFYAVAQKNLGSAGTTMVAINKDFLKKSCRNLPPVLDYKAHAKANSVLNTPPVFAIYNSLLMLRWIDQKGLDTIIKENKAKAALLYTTLEQSRVFKTIVAADSRSEMNIVFKANSEKNEEDFIAFCTAHKITGVKGHRSVGGFRVSLYNAISFADTQRLVDTIKEFELNNTKK